MTETFTEQTHEPSTPDIPVVRHDIVVIGASAGGLEALLAVVGRLPADLPAAVFVVLHLPMGARSALADILARAGKLPACAAQDGSPIAAGQIYVAPPNRYHLVLQPGQMRLVYGPRENGTRPAADPLFCSAARVYGPRVVGVILSGTGADGTEGLKAVVGGGGVAIVQEPREAQFAGMPHVAIHRDSVSYVLPAAEIGPRLDQLARKPSQPGDDPPGEEVAETGDALPGSRLPKRQGEAAGLMCPDCGGPLWEAREGSGYRFECRVGHSWSDANSLAESHSFELEHLAWGFINALAERAFLMGLMSQEASEGEDSLAMRAESVRDEADRLAAVIRERLPAVL